MLTLDREDAPFVPAIARRGRDGIWSLIVEYCPHCGRRHLHGGGNDEQPEGSGHRVAHCGAGGRKGYVLMVERQQ